MDETESKKNCEGLMGLSQFSAKAGMQFKHLNFRISDFPYIPSNRLANNCLDNHVGNLIKLCDMVINDFYFWLVKDLDYNKTITSPKAIYYILLYDIRSWGPARIQIFVDSKGSVKSVQPSTKSSCLASVLLAFSCLSVITVLPSALTECERNELH